MRITPARDPEILDEILRDAPARYCPVCMLPRKQFITLTFEVKRGGGMYRSANFIKANNGMHREIIEVCILCAEEMK